MFSVVMTATSGKKIGSLRAVDVNPVCSPEGSNRAQRRRLVRALLIIISGYFLELKKIFQLEDMLKNSRK